MAITDAHMDSLVKEIASLLPRCGEKVDDNEVVAFESQVKELELLLGELTRLEFRKAAEVACIGEDIKWYHQIPSGTSMGIINQFAGV